MIIPPIHVDDHSDHPIEHLSSEVSVQWIDGGRILVNRFLSARPETYDVWEAWFMNVLKAWPPDRPVCQLYDLSSPQFTITLYIGTKIRQLSHQYGRAGGFSAIVHAKRSFNPILFNLSQMIPPPTGRVREYFTDYDEAVKWLQEQFESAPAVVSDPARPQSS